MSRRLRGVRAFVLSLSTWYDEHGSIFVQVASSLIDEDPVSSSLHLLYCTTVGDLSIGPFVKPDPVDDNAGAKGTCHAC